MGTAETFCADMDEVQEGKEPKVEKEVTRIPPEEDQDANAKGCKRRYGRVNHTKGVAAMYEEFARMFLLPTDQQEEGEIKYPRQKVALLMGYSGAGYKGMQMLACKSVYHIGDLLTHTLLANSAMPK